MLLAQRLAQQFLPVTHGSTYRGNALAATVADKVVELVNMPGVMNRVKERAAHCLAALRAINRRDGIFRELRGMGLLIGAELSEPYAGRAKDFVEAALEQQLMLLNAGPNVLRLAPLAMSFEVFDEGFHRFEAAVKTIVLAGTSSIRNGKAA